MAFAKKTKTILVAGASIVIIATVVCVHGIRRVSPKVLDNLIQQKLPLGTDESEVATFLDSYHISHSAYSPQSQVIYGEIERSNIGLVNSDIHLMFGFDEHGKLIRHTVVELRRWP